MISHFAVCLELLGENRDAPPDYQWPERRNDIRGAVSFIPTERLIRYTVSGSLAVLVYFGLNRACGSPMRLFHWINTSWKHSSKSHQ